MQRRSPICAALILVSCGALPEHPQECLLQSRHASTIETPLGLGTGFPISDTSWLTAWHVVEGTPVEMITASGLEVLEVIRVGDLDACVLVTEPHNREPWPLADRIPLAGERVFKSGYGAGEHWWTEGIATEDADRIAIDIFHGDSGGPLFDAQGNVLGVIVSMGGYGYEGRILHHARIVPMALILAAMPEGLLEGLELPHGPLPVGETPWERFL